MATPDKPETLFSPSEPDRPLLEQTGWWIVAGVVLCAFTLNRGLRPLWIAGIAIGAVTLLLAVWNPPLLAAVAARRERATWFLSRAFVIIIAAGVIATTLTTPQTTEPTCPEQVHYDGYGPLVHARLRGDTMVCVYHTDTSGQL